MITFLVTLAVVLILGDSKHHGNRGGQHQSQCRRMDLKILCETSEGKECKDHIPDYDRVCKLYRTSTAEKSTTILSSEKVPYWDAAPPTILVFTQNVTVAPGEKFDIQCMAEGAPAPYVEISFREDADLSPLPDDLDTNSVDIEKRAVQTLFSQPFAIYEDEGWYRCVAKNEMGVVFEDTFLTVASPQDICENVECPDLKVCEADFETGEAICVCPYCSLEDFENDNKLYCGSDCSTVLSMCSFAEEQCKGVNVHYFHDGYCSNFSQPEYSFEEIQQTELEYGDEVQLTCRGIPAGDSPGPEPLIRWYQDWGDQFGGRELLGEGNTLSYTAQMTTSLICVGVHCSGSDVQRRETDIKYFNLVLPVITPEPISTEEEEKPSTTSLHIPTTPLPPTARADGGAVCQIMGDPFVSTFDNKWYKQDGVCTYVLAMDCRFAQWFVYGRFTQFGDISSLETITVYSGRSVLELQRGWIINNNGEKLAVTVGKEHHFNQITYQFDGETLTLKFGEGNQIRWNGFNGAQIVTSPDAHTCGLCGNNNGETEDEFNTRYRQMAEDPYTFASSWGLRQSRACFKNEISVEITSEAEGACSFLFFHPYILKCHDTVPVQEYELACARSYASNTYEGWRAECNILQSYVLQCETRGLNLSQWRQRTSCTPIKEVQKFTIENGCPQDNPPV